MDTVFLMVVVLFAALLGAVAASFITATIVRGLQGHQGFGMRSECDHCHQILPWYQLIPLLSYPLLRGKCAYCQHKIETRYWLAEILGTICFGVYAWIFGQQVAIPAAPSQLLGLIACGVVLLLMLYLSIYDMLSFSIPAGVVKLTLGVSLIANVGSLAVLQFGGYSDQIAILFSPVFSLGKLDNLLAAGVFALLFYLLVRVTKEKGIGLGDVMVVAIMGLMLGTVRMIAAFYVMLFTALIAGLIMVGIKKQYKGLMVPLVPFMTLGFVIGLGWGVQIFNWLFRI